MGQNGIPTVDAEPVDEVVEIEGASVPALVSKVEIDIQIATARRFPRDLDRFKSRAHALAISDPETAGSMFYALKRQGKTIEGPSVRFAEIVFHTYGNLHGACYSTEPNAKDRFVRARGVMWDLEMNNRVGVEVARRITASSGSRYSDDMIGVTQNQAVAVAFRQSVFKVVPPIMWKSIYEAARKASLGAGKTMEERRARALEWFSKLGAKPEDVLRVAGVKVAEDLTDEHLIVLNGIRTSIRDAETTWENVMRDAQGGAERAASIIKPPSLLSLDGALNGKATGTNDTTPGGTEPGREAASSAETQAVEDDDTPTF